MNMDSYDFSIHEESERIPGRTFGIEYARVRKS